jgi:hypothetical protein
MYIVTNSNCAAFNKSVEVAQGLNIFEFSVLGVERGEGNMGGNIGTSRIIGTCGPECGTDRIERAGSAGNSTNWFICRYVTLQCKIGVCPAYSALRCRIRWLHQVEWSWCGDRHRYEFKWYGIN